MIDSFEAVAEILRRQKREVVRAHGNDPDESRSDLHMQAIVVREGRPIAGVMSGLGPDGPREAAYWAAALLRGDEIQVVTDARMRVFDQGDQAEAEHVVRGQFQEDWERGDRGKLTECLVAMRIPQVGEPVMRVWPYERRGRTLKWLKHIDIPERAEGALIEYAQQGFADSVQQAEVMAKITLMADLMGMPEAEREYHVDRALALFASEKVGAVGLYDPPAIFIDGKEDGVSDDS